MALIRALALALLAAGAVWLIAERLGLRAAHIELDQTLLLTARAVEAEVERQRPLPDIAAEDGRIRSALAGTGAFQDASKYLATVAEQARADVIFLIDAKGKTLAASNWNEAGSFVGQNYAFRPYFKQAMETGRGQFYAIGVTTGVPGYFIASRVDVPGAQGVLVVKLDLRVLQDTWRAADADVALMDEHGVVFLSGRPDWQYRALAPLSAETLAKLAEARAYESAALESTPPLLRRAPEGGTARGEGWIARLAPMPATGWQVIAARDSAPMQIFAFGWAALAALATLAIAAALKAFEQRRQIIALRLSQSEKLESMVIARTADLAREVEARRQAEVDLRTTQEALIHTEKMAALGRMSAAIVHEISQPLAAMEATLSAAELGMNGEDTATQTRLGKARGLIRRMQRTTQHLKSFARKDTTELSLIDMRGPVASALDLVAPRARAVGIVPAFAPPQAAVEVMAGAVRLEQVAVNLLLNALDAVADAADAAQPEIVVTLEEAEGAAQLTVRDTGAGIAEADLARVAEPFFSTKLTGEGLGLGLSICKAILADFGGSLQVHSAKGEGTLVTVRLPLAESKKARGR